VEEKRLDTLHLSGDSCELSGASKMLIFGDVSSVGNEFSSRE